MKIFKQLPAAAVYGDKSGVDGRRTRFEIKHWPLGIGGNEIKDAWSCTSQPTLRQKRLLEFAPCTRTFDRFAVAR